MQGKYRDSKNCPIRLGTINLEPTLFELHFIAYNISFYITESFFVCFIHIILSEFKLFYYILIYIYILLANSNGRTSIFKTKIYTLDISYKNDLLNTGKL